MSVDSVPSDEVMEQGRLLFAKECQFLMGAVSPETLPKEDMPEIAFAGRSNVGKSSLLNALLGRKNLARTSNTPGRTQQINFFDLSGQLRLVDLPGYGYAKASKKEVAGWNKLIRVYLQKRANLRRVCLLIDSRHGIKPVDQEIMTLLDDSAVAYFVILTKTDKIKKSEVATVTEQVEAELAKHTGAFPKAYPTSSEKKLGFDVVRGVIAGML